jgi:F0F1-type ATP synthase alpha subunit
MVGRSKHAWFSIDGKGPIGGIYENAVRKKSLVSYFRQPVTSFIQTGLKQADAMMSAGRDVNHI